MNAKAYMVFGVKLNFDVLYETRTVKAFDHNYGGDFVFCPKTGQKLWESKNVPKIPSLLVSRDLRNIEKRYIGGYTGMSPLHSTKDFSPSMDDAIAKGKKAADVLDSWKDVELVEHRCFAYFGRAFMTEEIYGIRMFFDEIDMVRYRQKLYELFSDVFENDYDKFCDHFGIYCICKAEE